MSLEGAPKRIAVFFDTHEAFWGQEHDLPDALFFERDEWLRRLLLALEFSRGIVVVAAGRDIPRWPEATKTETRIPKEYLDLQLVWHFSEKHALQYLERAGVADSTLQQSIVAYTSVAADQIHPYLLGLCADVALAAQAQGITFSASDFRVSPETINKEQMLIDRLLRYVNQDTAHAVRALSACRAFDREIYFKLGAALRFAATESSFRTLTQFSFVRPLATEQSKGWYRIHEILRRMFAERNDEDTHRADEVLEQYFREKAETNEPAAAVEAIYHAYRSDAARGFKEWQTTFEAALLAARYSLCQSLLQVLSEMRFDRYARGLTDLLVSNYFIDLAQYDQALSLQEQAVQDFDDVLRGELTDNYTAAKKQGSATGRPVICISRNGADVRIDKGRALAKRGELHTRLAQYAGALADFQEAVGIADESLQATPDDADSLLLGIGAAWDRRIANNSPPV